MSSAETAEKASKIAKKYIEIHDELRILECSSFVFHTDHDTAQLHELNQVSDTLREQASENQSEIESLMTQRNQLSEDAERIEKEETFNPYHWCAGMYG